MCCDCMTISYDAGCTANSACEDWVCSQDSYCCNWAWDDICVYDVASYYCRFVRDMMSCVDMFRVSMFFHFSF